MSWLVYWLGYRLVQLQMCGLAVSIESMGRGVFFPPPELSSNKKKKEGRSTLQEPTKVSLCRFVLLFASFLSNLSLPDVLHTCMVSWQ